MRSRGRMISASFAATPQNLDGLRRRRMSTPLQVLCDVGYFRRGGRPRPPVLLTIPPSVANATDTSLYTREAGFYPTSVWFRRGGYHPPVLVVPTGAYGMPPYKAYVGRYCGRQVAAPTDSIVVGLGNVGGQKGGRHKMLDFSIHIIYNSDIAAFRVSVSNTAGCFF